MIKNFYFLTFILLLGFSTQAQVDYEHDNGWNFGINMGATWQEAEKYHNSDTLSNPRAGFGAGLTLGKSIYERPNSFFAFDLRGRLLGGTNYGTIDKLFTDSLTLASSNVPLFNSYQMTLKEADLEGVLILHRLRERTGILMYGFGGIGVTNYKVDAGLSYEENPTLNGGREEIINETKFTPSLGFGLGYQITPSFSIGVEHKITYALNDKIDGGSLTGLEDGKNDCFHYTGINFRWNILHGKETYTAPDDHNDDWTSNNNNSNNNNNNNTPPPPPPPSGNKPIVNIYKPSTNNSVVHSPNYTIKAKIYYVGSTSGVKFKQNGLQNGSFVYNPNTKEFTANVTLQPGSNSFVVTGTNSFGSDQDSRIIIYKQEEYTSLPPPIVTITNPNTSPKTVTSSQYTIMATVLNVTSKNNIKFYLNGQSLTNFTYNASSKVLTASISLINGTNTVSITGTNSVGSDTKTAILKYQRPQEILPPLVTITKPYVNPYTTHSPVENINATVLRVAGKSAIKVLLNGSQITNFTYSTSSKKLSFSANLIVGTNIVQISGTNPAGTDSRSTTIIYQPSEVVNPPVVDFTVPSKSPYKTHTKNLTLKATVLNVSGHNNIQVTFNGSSLNNFSYNSTTKQVSFNVNLITGTNLFTVTGTNTAGTNSDNQTVVYTRASTEKPPLVNITKPQANPHNSNSNTQLINATILNVTTINNVSAKLNGATISGYSFDPGTHKFAYTAQLNKGANIFEVTGYNSKGTASKSQTIIYTPEEVPCIDPIIVLTQPTVPNKTAANSNMTVNTDNSKGAIVGNIKNATNVTFKINGKVSPGYNYNPQTGAFSSALHLTEGATTYVVTATNACGAYSQTITYIYTPVVACDNPIIQMTKPTNSPFEFKGTGSYTFTASIVGVTNAALVQAVFNSNPVQISFDVNTGKTSGALKLKVGKNKLIVIARNACGTMQQETIINYSLPSPPPVVTITNPASFPHSQGTGKVSVSATITNITSKSDVEVYVDGKAITAFKYANGAILLPLNLSIGSHNLIVKGTNTSGTDSKTVEIIIEQALPQPIDVQFMNISETSTQANPEQVGSGAFVVKGKVLNFAGAQVVCYVGGSAWPLFNYNSNDGTFQFQMQFNFPGDVKSVFVKAVGPSGSDQEIGYLRLGAAKQENTTNTDYQNTIDKANKFYGSKNYSQALIEYQKASNLKPNESFPKQRISAIKLVQAQDKLNKQYQAHIKKGDLYYTSGKYATAKVYYQKALGIKPNDKYAKGKLESIKNKLSVVKPNKGNVSKPTNTNVIKPNTGGKTTKPTNTNVVKPTTGGAKTNSGSVKPTTGTTKPSGSINNRSTKGEIQP